MPTQVEMTIQNLKDAIANFEKFIEELEKEDFQPGYLELANMILNACDKEGVYFNYLQAVRASQSKEKAEEAPEGEEEQKAEEEALSA